MTLAMPPVHLILLRLGFAGEGGIFLKTEMQLPGPNAGLLALKRVPDAALEASCSATSQLRIITMGESSLVDVLCTYIHHSFEPMCPWPLQHTHVSGLWCDCGVSQHHPSHMSYQIHARNGVCARIELTWNVGHGILWKVAELPSRVVPMGC